MNSPKKETILYWVLTTPFLALMLMSACVYLMGTPHVVEGLAHLGYPLFMAKILGTAKLLGVVAILYNRSTLLKEWAYAGFIFNMLGAIASHLFAGDPSTTVIAPAVFIVIIFSSYSLWKRKTLRLALNS